MSAAVTAIASTGFDGAIRGRVESAPVKAAPAAAEAGPGQAAHPSPAAASIEGSGVYSVAIGSQHRAAIIEQTADGFTASFPSVPRAVASGASLQEAEARLAQVIDLLA